MKNERLNDIPLKISYRSGTDNLVDDFYEPCLARSKTYRRAVGYFTSASMARAAGGIASLVSRRGMMFLVASPFLEEGDIDALRLAESNRDMLLREITARSFGEIRDLLIRDRLTGLAWLAASNLLQMKLALRCSKDGDLERGIYHEKIGLFSDAAGNLVAFSGSSNETPGGLVDNFESIRVFWSWDDPHQHTREHLEHFEALWSNQTEGLEVIDFTEAAAEILRPYHRDPPKSFVAPGEISITSGREIPSNLTMRDYQLAALENWKEAGGQGILAMATGAGKTITALYLACRMHESISPLVMVVVCPYSNLARQWIEEMEKFGIELVGCFESRAKWEREVTRRFSALFSGKSDHLALVVTNRTFLSEPFQSALRPEKIPHFLIADEVHNLGADKISRILNPNITYRLGLSATPDRHYDEAGTAAIKDYFGEVVYEFPIEEAIKRNILSRYRYYPILVNLTDAETDEYFSLTKQIGKAMPTNDSDPMSDRLRMLLIERARLLGAAEGKLPALRKVIEGLDEPVGNAIIYCGDGKTEDERQIVAATRLLGNQCGLRLRRFTCDESMEEREEILASLREGNLDALVAIRCLDEGIDVPGLEMGFILASSTNPRQFIQRRGRLLRKAPGKKVALIWDFIVRPPDAGDFNVERRLFKRELKRIIEFCRTAENGVSALNELRDLRSEYNLLAF